MLPQTDNRGAGARPNAVTTKRRTAGGPLGKKDSRTMPNKGGSGSAKKHVMPAMYKFKWPSVTSAYDARGQDVDVDPAAQPGGLNGMNFPDAQVRVSGRKGVKRIY